jgi:hypothetical protein
MDYDRSGALNIDEATKMLSQLMSDVSNTKVALHFIEADRNLNQQLNFPGTKPPPLCYQTVPQLSTSFNCVGFHNQCLNGTIRAENKLVSENENQSS